MPIDDSERKVIRDVKAAAESASQAINVLVGHLVISGWFFYYKYVRLAIASFMPRLLTIMVLVDFLAAWGKELGGMHEDLHRSKGPVSGFHAWIDNLGISSELVLEKSRLYKVPKCYLHDNEQTILLTVSCLTLVLAYIVYTHHHILTNRVQQHLEFLDSIRRLTAEATELVVSQVDPEKVITFIERLLQALVDSTTKLKIGHTKSVGFERIAMLLANDNGGAFYLAPHRQWPADKHKLEFRVPMAGSAAGEALKSPEHGDPEFGNGVVYIPATYFPHGTRHVFFDKKPRVEYVSRAFANLGRPGEPKPKSLICIEVLVSQSATSKYVLCLESNRTICFGDLDFQAIYWIGSMIGIILAAQQRASAASSS